jgi:hypothetical protein
MDFGKRSFSRAMTSSASSFLPSEMRPSATFEPSSGEVSHAVVSRPARSNNFPGSPLFLWVRISASVLVVSSSTSATFSTTFWGGACPSSP